MCMCAVFVNNRVCVIVCFRAWGGRIRDVVAALGLGKYGWEKLNIVHMVLATEVTMARISIM